MNDSKEKKGEGNKHVFLISKVFPASRELLYNVWTDVNQLKNWMAPKGCKIRYTKAEIKPGGSSLCSMTSPDGNEMWGKASYRELLKPKKIVYSQHFSNEKGEIMRHPLSPTWPREMLTQIGFEQEGKMTKLTLTWTPLNATEEELQTFANSKDGMTQGWSGIFEVLESYLRGLGGESRTR